MYSNKNLSAQNITKKQCSTDESRMTSLRRSLSPFRLR